MDATEGVPRAEVRAALVAIVRKPDSGGDVVARLSPAELDAVLRSGDAQGLGSLLVATLRSAGLPVPLWLESRRFDTSNQRARLMHLLAALGPQLTESGIPWVVLKGPLTAALYESFAQREFVDLDILVPGDRLAATLDVLTGFGVDGINRNWGEYLRHGVAEFPVVVMGMPLDLHWHLIGLNRTRRRFDIPMGEVMERRRPIQIGEVSVFGLDAVDHAIHAALHAGLSGAGRIGSLRDVHEIVGAAELEWDVLVPRARRYGCGPVVGQVLDRCRVMLGTPVPTGVAEELAPRPALRLRRWVDGRRPRSGLGPDLAFSGLLVDASRSSAVHTLGRTRELLWDRVTMALGRAARWSAYDPEGPLYWDRPSGGPDALQRYLEYAAHNG